MTDFRALCAELLEWAEHTSSHYYVQPDVLVRARAALAEQDGPTDAEIMELMPQEMRDDLAAAARALSSFDLNYIKAASVFLTILNRHVVNHARAVLTKWSRQ